MRASFLAVLALAASAVLVPTLAAPAGANHFSLIQPGALMSEPNGCTMNFVFTDQAGKVYIGTASHCVRSEGQEVFVDDILIGTVAWKAPVSQVDVALVAILPSLYGQVDPSVRYWGGPTGVATPVVQFQPKAIYHYGYGLGYGASEYGRPRAGVLDYQDGLIYRAQTTAVFGDSGSPIILSTGEALGIVSHFALVQVPPHTDEGPTIQYVIARALSDKGLRLTLQMAPLINDPLQRETDRLGHGPLG